MVVLGYLNGDGVCVFGFTWGRCRCFNDLDDSRVSVVTGLLWLVSNESVLTFVVKVRV